MATMVTTGTAAGGAATLHGLRVLDVGDRPSTAWCGRLLADLGADVIGGEPPEGHPLRSDPPAAAYFLANRRRAGLPAVLSLAAGAEVILTTESSAQTSVAALRELSGTALIACISAYGRGSTLAGHPGNDLTAYATSGWASVNGLTSHPPLKGPGYNASFQAGTFAWAAVIAALLGEPAGEVLDIAERDVLYPLPGVPAPAVHRHAGAPPGVRRHHRRTGPGG
jgi:crotonobetainyl-CoA:carnitine CoA-transferase CaiB-like acyl-CoA transferase